MIDSQKLDSLTFVMQTFRLFILVRTQIAPVKHALKHDLSENAYWPKERYTTVGVLRQISGQVKAFLDGSDLWTSQEGEAG